MDRNIIDRLAALSGQELMPIRALISREVTKKLALEVEADECPFQRGVTLWALVGWGLTEVEGLQGASHHSFT